MCKVIYKHDTFIDYKGAEIEFTLAAVSIPTEAVIIVDGKPMAVSTKMLSVGAAFRHPNDAPDDVLAEEIAYGKAMARKEHTFFATDNGMVNTAVVEATLNQEAAYIKMNPGRYIASYDRAKERYLAAKAKEDYLKSLTEEQKLAIDVVARIGNLDKFLEAVEDHRKNISRPDGVVATKLLSQPKS